MEAVSALSPCDRGEDVARGRVRGETEGSEHAGLVAGFRLGGDVADGGGVVADEDDGESGASPPTPRAAARVATSARMLAAIAVPSISCAVTEPM